MTRDEAYQIRAALDSFVGRIADAPAEINTHMVAIHSWKPGVFEADKDVRMYEGIPYKCVQGHDSTANPGWNPADTPALWMQYHGTTVETARPWIAPTGAHDMYKQGEYMIWTDGAVYCCKSDTIFSPGDYAQAWMRITQ